jgi:hypothetical protein
MTTALPLCHEKTYDFRWRRGSSVRRVPRSPRAASPPGYPSGLCKRPFLTLSLLSDSLTPFSSLLRLVPPFSPIHRLSLIDARCHRYELLLNDFPNTSERARQVRSQLLSVVCCLVWLSGCLAVWLPVVCCLLSVVCCLLSCLPDWLSRCPLSIVCIPAGWLAGYGCLSFWLAGWVAGWLAVCLA